MYQELRQVWDALTGPGGQFEITEVEVRGQTLRTYANQPPSLREMWLMSAGHGDKDYLVYGEERITYAEAHRQVAQIASWLREQGVEPGDRVAIAMRNYPEWMLAYWACVSTGVACVGMNAWWVGPEIVYGIEDSDPKVVIADTERLAAMMAVKDELGERTFVGVRVDDLPPGVVPWAEITVGETSLPEVTVDPDTDACIFYTSGTTGRPKGAQLTHRGCVANVMSLAFANTVQTEAAKLAQAGEDAGLPASSSPSASPSPWRR